MKNLIHFTIIYLKMTVNFYRKYGQIFQPQQNEQKTLTNRSTENLIHDFIPTTQIFFY